MSAALLVLTLMCCISNKNRTDIATVRSPVDGRLAAQLGESVVTLRLHFDPAVGGYGLKIDPQTGAVRVLQNTVLCRRSRIRRSCSLPACGALAVFGVPDSFPAWFSKIMSVSRGPDCKRGRWRYAR
jgi:hypothetical protein